MWLWTAKNNHSALNITLCSLDCSLDEFKPILTQEKEEGLNSESISTYSPLCSLIVASLQRIQSNSNDSEEHREEHHLKHSFSCLYRSGRRWTSLEELTALNLYPKCGCTPFPLESLLLLSWTFQLHEKQEVGISKLSMTSEKGVFYDNWNNAFWSIDIIVNWIACHTGFISEAYLDIRHVMSVPWTSHRPTT